MADNTSFRYAPQDRTPPGDTLAETLDALGMTQLELADRVGLSRKTINQIIQGIAPITADTAIKLETALGTPAAFWLNLDANYQEFLARKAQQLNFQHAISWLQRIPYKEMVGLGWLPPGESDEERVGHALAYYGTATPALWASYWEKCLVSFRKSRLATDELGIVSAWLRKGELDAQQLQTQPFDADKFKAALKQIRPLTKTPAPEFQPKMQSLCAEAGVALVLTPELKKLRVSGATYWLTKDKALVQLSLLYKSDDHFWFTFFHEAKHVLQQIKTNVFMEGVKDDDAAEKEANDFACDFLIPKEKYAEFVQRGSFREASISSFARELDIAPGILVGRLQHDKLIKFSHCNSLKRRFFWVKH